MDSHALREGALDIVKRGVDAIGQFQGVDPRLFLNANDDGRFGIVRAFASFDRCTFANSTDVLYEHRSGFRGLDADRGDGVDVTESPDAAYQVLLSLCDLKSCGCVLVRSDQCFLNFLKRHLVCREAYWIQDYFVLLLLASRGDDLRDARHSQKPTSDDGFRDGSDFQ